MITQVEADDLLKTLKILMTDLTITFPNPGEFLILDAKSVSNTDKFKIDVNRKGTIKISKCTYQARYNNNIKLVRIDLDGPDHPNPDGTIIPCPHIHIYKEGYDLKWAYPLNKKLTTNPSDLLQVLIDFLTHINVTNINQYQFQGGGLV